MSGHECLRKWAIGVAVFIAITFDAWIAGAWLVMKR